jgi:hypothetical protein
LGRLNRNKDTFSSGTVNAPPNSGFIPAKDAPVLTPKEDPKPSSTSSGGIFGGSSSTIPKIPENNQVIQPSIVAAPPQNAGGIFGGSSKPAPIPDVLKQVAD